MTELERFAREMQYNDLRHEIEHLDTVLDSYTLPKRAVSILCGIRTRLNCVANDLYLLRQEWLTAQQHRADEYDRLATRAAGGQRETA